MNGEWREIRVGDLVSRGVLEISDGYRVRNEELGPEGIPFVRGGDIRDGWINTNTEDHIRPELIERVRAKLTQPRDAAFITKGTVGRAGRLRPEQPPVVFAPQVAYWRVNDREVLDPTFVFYLMRSYEFQAALDGVKTHGAMAADYVSISQQHDFSFRLPDIASQRSISHILGTLDDKIELNRRMSETLETMARALFKSWFVDFDPTRAKARGEAPESICRRLGITSEILAQFPNCIVDSELGEIPEGWEPRRVDDLLELAYGKALKASDRTGGPVPVYGSGGITGLHDVCLVSGPGIIVGRKGTVGSLYWEDRSFYPIDTVFYVVPHIELTFCFYLLQTLGLERMNTDAAVPGLNRHNVYRLAVLLPPAGLRREFDRIVRELRGRLLACTQEIQTLSALRDVLLPKLISGELRIADAERFLAASEAASTV